ncbi:MAG: transglutaminase-like domain-containing protein [Bacteroidales bacterium]|nr:transglutaminase-like domain-containing protein [Bacteroidales bacterium]
MSKKSERDILALISMADDPDQQVFEEISAKIVAYGPEALSYLEDAYDQAPGEMLRDRLASLMTTIRFNSLSSKLHLWAKSNHDDLLEPWIEITRFFRPHLDESSIRSTLGKFTKDLWLEMNDNLTALEQIKVFNHIFYGIYKFRGDIEDYHNPDNSFIDRVMDERKGSPLSIGIIYMLLARSVDLPVRGINLPEHFVLTYLGERLDTESLQIHRDQPLFYINAFSGGSVFSSDEINEFLLKLDLEPLPSFFMPCTNREIIIRMLNNLIFSYEQIGQGHKVKGFAELRDRLQ